MRSGLARTGMLLLFLAGCATLQPTPYATPEGRLGLAKANLDKGEYEQAMSLLDQDLRRKDGAGKAARDLLARTPGFSDSVLAALRGRIAAVDTLPGAKGVKRRIDDARATGAVDAAEIAALEAELERKVAEGVRARTLTATLDDDIAEFPSLKAPDARDAMFRQSIDALANPRVIALDALVEATFAHAEAAGVGSPQYLALKAALPSMKLKRKMIDTVVQRVFPDEAAKRLAKLTVPVHVAFDPPDRLLQEDLFAELRKSQALRLVERKDAEVVVTVGKLQFEVNQRPERTSTVSYSYHQVDLLKAVMLMPQNASYFYEVTESGAEIAYAFEIKAHSKGAQIADNLLRAREVDSSSYCSNPRVQNVFGGVSPAGFVANDHMQGNCRSFSRSTVSTDTLRSRVYGKLAQSILDIGPIAEAVAANR
jgi:hypothetical protein